MQVYMCKWPEMLVCMLQLELAKEQGLPEKQREILWRISDCYDKAGYLDIAENHLKELLEQELSEEQKLEALCFLADIQVGLGAFSDSCETFPYPLLQHHQKW